MIDRYTPKTVIRAFESCKKPILTKDYGSTDNINVSSTLTRIIQEVGRFCENYASDMFITWKSVEKLYENRKDVTETETYYETFAIRRQGVDGNGFLIERLKNTQRPPYDYVYADQAYRRILCLKIRIEPTHIKGMHPDVTLELKNITDSFIRLDPDDR